jgi:hypothetical protein
VIGRLKPNVSLEAAQSDIARIAANLAQEYPQLKYRYNGVSCQRS